MRHDLARMSAQKRAQDFRINPQVTVEELEDELSKVQHMLETFKSYTETKREKGQQKHP